ncbi:hypothetical protein [Paenibacillus sp. A3M_27_13]|uniref:hypothetical protein n=1 Tax=Paenibacillus sp. A3M_27_13 TaxID=2962029 RepID=UPI0020B7E05E|nr:hypothetical protein [Paenibacillus sp. A3M_27_13]MCP3746796.1 hypothetical protein [Paenibacillus sp. A3M_27_13]
MKLNVMCLNCKIQGEINESLYDLTDSLSYEFTCNRGHKNVFLLDSHKFELLFQMGLYAYSDGYFREAVTNFAAAIERFHEFCIAVLSWEHGNEKKVFNQNSEIQYSQINDEFNKEYKDAWKELSRQSERQLGAYIMLYLVTFKCKPHLIPSNWVEFRNGIVHKGAFPTANKTSEYAEVTFNYIKDKLLQLKTAFPESTEKVYSKAIQDYKDQQLDSYNGSNLITYKPYTALRVGDKIEALTNLDFEEAKKQAHALSLSKMYI